ncbi:serine/threonine protein kinase ppk15, putative [Entamoeba invadens IP1]|uniref:Serine/threonine protein kinase ppk15, putative n=1 Tax=Entamoeba invadens IP1 TaxID=370355 RepID=A0A0A1UBR4_ENTIV|nr:serine/threonine protein kinase ppk15, putative [Entamoeba invadens IP1]ELP92597.1 serine/threonine protein kinase ppk15, putative [Entamoeba invadens IP1]|eukprot:XP_004259368.1 serine/threonine protein kinase ppk15, putative [Entamoeba invadens IP1]
MTTALRTTFNRCGLNEEDILTDPMLPGSNPRDNEYNDLIVKKDDIIGSLTSLEGPDCSMNPSVLSQYKVVSLLGEGTFGQVFHCIDLNTNTNVAVKILKNHTAYFRQGLIEVSVLMILNAYYEQERPVVILKMYDHFMYYNHICIVTELLGTDLYHLMKENKNKGFSIRTIRKFLFHLLHALQTLSQANVVHCDVKPENVLLQGMSSNIKLIDFGSACFENFTMNTYIQSRHYRAPEIVLGLPYSCAIDMWSVGCIAAEFFLGIPLFAGTSEYNLLFKMIDMLGMPPVSMLDKGTRTKEFFKKENGVYQLKEQFEYEAENNVRLQTNRHYFSYHLLEDLIEKNPMKVSTREVDEVQEIRASLYDFMVRCLAYDPKERLTPDQALSHPFIIGIPIEGYVPSIRRFEYKEYGKVMTLEGDEYVKHAFEGVRVDVTESQMYYKLFMHALNNGHVINVLTESPFVGSITPHGLSDVFGQKPLVVPVVLQKGMVPRTFVPVVEEFAKEVDNIESVEENVPASPSPSLSEKKKKMGFFKEIWRRITPGHSPALSPKMSPKVSPKASPKASPKVSPKSSPKNSPRINPKKSLTSSTDALYDMDRSNPSSRSNSSLGNESPMSVGANESDSEKKEIKQKKRFSDRFIRDPTKKKEKEEQKQKEKEEKKEKKEKKKEEKDKKK